MSVLNVLHFKASDIELLFDNNAPSDIKYKYVCGKYMWHLKLTALNFLLSQSNMNFTDVALIEIMPYITRTWGYNFEQAFCHSIPSNKPTAFFRCG